VIYRIILSAIALVAFTADYHFAPGGAKFILSSTSAMLFILSVLFTWSWIIFWDLVLPRFSWFVNPVLMGLMTLIHYYELNSGAKLDASMIVDNWRGVSDSEGLRLLFGLMYDTFVAANVFWAVVIMSLMAFTYREKRSRLKNYISRVSKFLIASPFIIVLILSLFFRSSFENYSGLVRGLIERAYAKPNRFDSLATEAAKQLEGVNVRSALNSSKEPMPNVIIVFVESLSNYFVETKSIDNLDYMPYLNSLLKEGIYFEQHHSVSVQTTRGHFAAMCGKIPLYQGLESEDFEKKNFDCLPRYLKNLGYKSIFMQAFGKHNFDNTTQFLLSQGFDEVPKISEVCDREKPGAPCWNWGIQDDEFYRRVFDRMKSEKQPFFLALATITSHMPFTGTPENLIIHFKKPKNRFENYVNTLTVVDDGLKVLIEKLKESDFGRNTVLIITGDHGFPMGQHDNFHNENYAFEENFRVPLLMIDFRNDSLWKKGERVQFPTSHMNLPATILELAGFSGKTSFEAESLLEHKQTDRVSSQPVYLVQPYSGILLGSIRWPWKYLYENNMDREWIYDLAKDPNEMNSLSESKIPKNTFDKLQVDVEAIRLNNQQVHKLSRP
jgi:arylsulfatase A-like enzyme